MSYRLLRGFLLKIVFPILMLACAFGGKERLQAVVIDLNNRLVRKERPGIKRLLLLLPHCLQIDECKIRLTHNIHNCEGCGRCGIKDLISIADENRLDLFVATGGNLARRIVGDVRPDAIVAVACERDLSSGIADTYPLPVLGICNERPSGPCLNTKVDLGKVKEAISFLGRR
ncbi:MAG: DUF116 domain-containing protein [Parvibaculum sp.]|uniref:DUF116 domain-containing protein n=1 Tax=Parvibaculum sp. TaxID=2024848 RepID=UPI00272F8B5C|nr:DUF116 domain-containing protein [Parvibaculum sp.]MDP2151602.1 DUF116 domain-containing protein [Parvibaculum sp.]